MPVNLTTHKSNTPQTEYARPDQIRNTAGGVVFKLDPWQHLDRFLLLGTEGGTFYASEGTLTRENARNLSKLIAEDDMRVFQRVKEVSTQGLAYKQDYTLFALAMLMAEGSTNAKRAIIQDFSTIARTGTHLFTFLKYVNDLRGWGRALRKAVASWYENMDAGRLEYQLVKYKQRNGWSHRDALRLAHPKVSGTKNELLAWVTQGTQPSNAPLVAWSDSVTTRSAREAVKAGLPREALPTEALMDPSVWTAMLEKGMPLTAMIRNLGNMTKHGVLKPLSHAEKTVVSTLGDEDALKRSRIHPIQVLAALTTYAKGRGARGTGEWEPSTAIVSALDLAFYKTFQNVEPVGHRTLIALDVSGSMGHSEINGVPGLTPRMASAALSLVIANTEPWHHIVGFTSASRGLYGYRNAELTPLGITSADSVQTAVERVSGLPFGGTDCALPMLYAINQGLEVDTFIVLTDNETWAGGTHPFEALSQYRRKSGIEAKLAVVGMTATDASIADPNDDGMMDFVGFNPNMPQALSAFMRG